jgi:hypothetical protein
MLASVTEVSRSRQPDPGLFLGSGTPSSTPSLLSATTIKSSSVARTIMTRHTLRLAFLSRKRPDSPDDETESPFCGW